MGARPPKLPVPDPFPLRVRQSMGYGVIYTPVAIVAISTGDEPVQLQQEPRRLGVPAGPPPEEQSAAPAATGATQKIGVCEKCGDTIPPGARFCIECGAPT
jgi:hypothetical protein